MRQITIIIEDNEEGCTSMRFIESGNGAAETEAEMDLAVKVRALIMAFTAKMGALGKMWASGPKEEVAEEEEEIDPEIWRLFKDL
jgi:hypothetical protein